MYLKDQVVSYGVHGVCSVADIEVRSVKGRKVEYYALQPLDQPGTRFYVPTQGEMALSKMRPVLCRENVESVVNSAINAVDPWIPEENIRKQHYKTLISSGDTVALLSMARSIYKRREKQRENGGKMHMCDENFLKDAEKLLISEIAYAMSASPEEVRRLIYRA